MSTEDDDWWDRVAFSDMIDLMSEDKMQVTIGGITYEVTNEGQFGDYTSWMVRKQVGASSSDDESNYVETLISVPSSDPQVAVEAAIARGSWA